MASAKAEEENCNNNIGRQIVCAGNDDEDNDDDDGGGTCMCVRCLFWELVRWHRMPHNAQRYHAFIAKTKINGILATILGNKYLVPGKEPFSRK